MDAGPGICERGGRGWFLPLLDVEYDLSNGVRAFIYVLVMLYFFLGVSVVADIFMGSIETITSRRRQAQEKDGRWRTHKVWNETVATLTLMALGSSAPEIILSVMDIFKKNFEFGKLGPATILGSASFNLFVIVSVCVVAIPSDEVRKIGNLPAFFITAIFQFIAYGWLGVVLVNISVDRVDIWEAVVTFCLFPTLVWVSYRVDIGSADPILKRLGFLDRRKSTISHKDYITFSNETLSVLRGTAEQTCVVRVLVPDGFIGKATCSYRIEPLSARPGDDYVNTSGEISFSSCATQQTIEIHILPRIVEGLDCTFLVILDAVDGAAGFNPDDDGDVDCAILTVTVSDATQNGCKASALTKLCVALRYGCSDWVDQFRSAVYCNGSAEEQKLASCKDWLFHIAAFPWGMVAAFIPPTSVCRGWCSFISCLGFIGMITTILGDAAEVFGCVLGVPDIVTAIALVALGTSTPDLFASLSAATADPTADASIINVTGSNAVNVFLGVGIPFLIGSVYWKVNGRTADWVARHPELAAEIDGAVFVADSTHFGFGVIIFTFGSAIVLIIMYTRRRVVGGELGGALPVKIATFMCFVGMFIGFTSSVCWRALRFDHYWDDSSDFYTTEAITVFFGSFATMATLIFIVSGTLFLHWLKSRGVTTRGSQQDPPVAAAPSDSDGDAAI